MSIKEVFAVMFACVLANNYVLANFMGVEAVASDMSKSWKSMAFKGLYVTLTLLICAIEAWIWDTYCTTSAGQALTIMILSIIVLANSMFLGALFKNSVGNSSFDIPAALNSVVLGACLVNANEGYSLLACIFAGLGVGLGYMLVTFVMAGLMERINMKYVPKAWRGLPIMVAALAIVSLVIFAF
jgi:Na+-translocating ferredoxin:NAD+ oxidoreductase subunit A